jgi:hypothetical protein
MSDVATLRLVETGVAFLTGLDPGDAHGAAVDSRLRSAGLIPVNVDHAGEGHYYRINAPEHGTDVVASALAMMAPDQIELLLSAAPPVRGWEPVTGTLLLHDYGVGTASITWRPGEAHVLDEAAPALLDALREATERILRPLALDTTAALAHCFRDAPPAGEVMALLDSARDDLPAAGRTLWVWSHVRCSVPGAVDHESAARGAAGLLCPNDFHVLRHRDHTYAAGVAVSVTCSTEEHFSDGIALSRVIPRQDAWWALIWALDRALLTIQTTLPSVLHSPVGDLVAKGRAMQDVTTRVQLLQSRIDSILVNAGARELAVWQVLARAWALEVRTEAVARKLDYLRNAYAGVVEEINRRRTGQISVMIYLFTAVSVIASAVAVVQYTQGTPAADVATRLAVVAICIVAAAAAVASTLRVQQLRRRSKKSMR